MTTLNDARQAMIHIERVTADTTAIMVAQVARQVQVLSDFLNEQVAASVPVLKNENAPQPDEWDEARRIADTPEVFGTLQGFSEDPTGDNGIMAVREVMRSAPIAPTPCANCALMENQLTNARQTMQQLADGLKRG